MLWIKVAYAATEAEALERARVDTARGVTP